mgnify:CR=1 FL=1
MITSITFVGTQSEGSLTIEPGGVPGPTGPKPNHQWTGTSLMFELPNGSWGASVDLRGPVPAHEWIGTSLKFREPGGGWGDAVDLKGATGGTGTIGVGEVNTVAYGTPADVSNSGTSTAAVLDFDIPAGPGVELQKSATHIQYRIQGAETWTDLVALADILGLTGWTPKLAVVADDERRVLQVADWFGGEGTKPATGDYIGSSGLVEDIGDAVDVRGPAGPEGSGDVTGPSDATDGHLAVFDGATGKLLKDGGAIPAGFSGAYGDLSGIPSTFPPSAHNHDERYYTEAEVDGLLDGIAGPAWEHIETIDIPNLTTSFIINFPAGYDEFDLVFEDAASGGGAIPFMTFGFRNGSSTTNCDFTGKKRVTTGVTETITEFSAQTFDVINACQFLRARITSPRSSVQYTALDLWGHNGGTNNQLTEIRGISKSSVAMDNVVVTASSGSFADVRIRVRGLVAPS